MSTARNDGGQAREIIPGWAVELTDLYAAEPDHAGTAWHVLAAFVLAGEEPPSALGLSGPQSDLVQAHYRKYDPNGSGQAAKRERDDLEAVC